MKKLLLLLSLIIISTVAICQSYYKISSNTVGVWNTNSQSYHWGTPNYVAMELTMKHNIIFISDNAGSVYVTGERIVNTDDYNHRQLAWNAYDEKNVSCIVKFVYPKNDGVLTGEMDFYVLYDEGAIEYEILNSRVP